MAKSGFNWLPQMGFWKRDGNLWFCERADLEAAIRESGTTEDHRRRRMGYGLHLLADALSGKRLNRYQVGMVEWGLASDTKESISMWTGR